MDQSLKEEIILDIEASPGKMAANPPDIQLNLGGTKTSLEDEDIFEGPAGSYRSQYRFDSTEDELL